MGALLKLEMMTLVLLAVTMVEMETLILSAGMTVVEVMMVTAEVMMVEMIMQMTPADEWFVAGRKSCFYFNPIQ